MVFIVTATRIEMFMSTLAFDGEERPALTDAAGLWDRGAPTMAGRSVKSKATRFRVPRELRYPSKMDINKMLNDLRMEREQISEAIMVMERLSLGQGKRRGMPPKWMTELKRRGRPKGSKNKPKDD